MVQKWPIQHGLKAGYTERKNMMNIISYMLVRLSQQQKRARHERKIFAKFYGLA